VFHYGTQAPIGKAMGAWPRLDGAPSPCSHEDKNYDARRRKMAHFIGMDFLFTQREYCQSVQTDSKGCKVLVNSSKGGNILAVKPVPAQFLDKPWFTRKLRFPRNYLGITKIEERVSKLSYMLHLLTQHGFPSRAVAKAVYRLSLVWCYTRYEDMRKHVHYVTREIQRSFGLSARSPWMSTRDLSNPPTFVGDIIHANGIVAPIWAYPTLITRRKLFHRNVKPDLNTRLSLVESDHL
jgi:hypothetical protein